MNEYIGFGILLALGVVIYFWLQKRKEPKPFSPGYTPSPDVFQALVLSLLELNRDLLIARWSKLLIESGSNYVPPTLGDNMSNQQIAEEIAALELGGRP